MNQKLEDLKAEQGWTDETFLGWCWTSSRNKDSSPPPHMQLKRIADSEGDPGEVAE